MDRNLIERLNKLSRALTEAEARNDVELIESLQDEIWEVEDLIDEETERDEESHGRDWS